MTSKHHLAAIMFSDIVGYSTTAHHDEKAAARQVACHHDILAELVPAYDGRIMNYYGDGSLCIFPSAVDAIQCALDIQRQLTTDDGIPLRIGIHLGEIYFESEQYIGDGINIAARIQGEAAPGQVLTSGAVGALVQNRSDLHLKFIGERTLKNISTPVKLYQVNDKLTGQSLPVTGKRRARMYVPGRNSVIVGITIICMLALAMVFGWNTINSTRVTSGSIAILPFTSLSDAVEDQYFSEGVADDIRSKLASISALDVRSKSSSAYVKESRMSAREIGKALDIHYILEGSVQRIGNGLQLNLALIDADNDQLVQPIHYESDQPEDLFSLQSEVAQRVLDLVQVNLLPGEQEKILAVESTNFDAHRYYLLGRSYLFKSSSVDDLKKSEVYFELAIREDPDYARAWAGLAEVRISQAAWGYQRVSEALPAVKEAAFMAFGLNPNAAEAQQAMGTVYEFEKQFTLAENAFRRAIELDPSHMLSYLRMARIYEARCAYAEAIRYAERAAKLDPLSPVAVSVVPTMLLRANKVDEAASRCLSYLETFPDDAGLLWNLGEIYAVAGDYDKAIGILRSRKIPTADYNFVLGYAYAKQGDTTNAYQVLDYLLDKTSGAYVPPAMIACIYYGLGDKEKTFEWLSQEENYFLVLLPVFRTLFDDPEFESIYAFRKT